MRIEGVPGVCRVGSDLLCYALGTLVLVLVGGMDGHISCLV
jgi:hypothetical protein